MNLVSLALRFEISFAFMLSWPISLFVAIAFSITNELAVKYYRAKSGILKKASTLIIFAFVNTLIFATGAFFQVNFIMHRGTERAYVSYENIKWYIQGVLCFAIGIVLWRMLFLAVPALVQWRFKSKNQGISSS